MQQLSKLCTFICILPFFQCNRTCPSDRTRLNSVLTYAPLSMWIDIVPISFNRNLFPELAQALGKLLMKQLRFLFTVTNAITEMR